MKAIIGKYPTRLVCDIHNRLMDNRHGYVNWPETQTKFEDFVESLEDFIQNYIYNPINWVWFDRRERKVKVRIDYHDTFSMDDTLGYIVLPMLKQLKKHKHGAPFVDVEDVPEYLRPTSEELAQLKHDGATDDKFFKRWDWVMNEMIFAFESLYNDWEEAYYPSENNGSCDWEGMQKYEDRVANGFCLFGKYFRSLWD